MFQSNLEVELSYESEKYYKERERVTGRKREK